MIGPQIIGPKKYHAAIAACVELFPLHLRALLQAHGTRIMHLRKGQTYGSVCPLLRDPRFNVDRWAAPPAGLFIIHDNIVLLRSTSVMTMAHELSHAIDRALGGGAYLSGASRRVREIFWNATRFVTPYSANNTEEMLAEGIRAYLEANDPRSPWEPATRARLREVDRDLYTFVSEIFDPNSALIQDAMRTAQTVMQSAPQAA